MKTGELSRCKRMTTSKKIASSKTGDVVCIWPENNGTDDYGFEHAIVLRPYNGSVSIEQVNSEITIPDYAIAAVLEALRNHKKFLAAKQKADDKK